jgi:hypothetical protein
LTSTSGRVSLEAIVVKRVEPHHPMAALLAVVAGVVEGAVLEEHEVARSEPCGRRPIGVANGGGVAVVTPSTARCPVQQNVIENSANSAGVNKRQRIYPKEVNMIHAGRQ